MSSLLVLPVARASDSNINPYAGALLDAFTTGTTTRTPVYTTAARTVEHTNPVVADSAGLWPAIYLDPAVVYRFRGRTAAGALISGMDFDPVTAGADAETLQSALNDFISFGDPYPVTAATALGAGQLNRYVVCSGTSADYTVNLPPVTADNIGDAVFVNISNACTKLVTIVAAAASGVLIDGGTSRVMHAGESAMLVFDGTEWKKLFGKTIPFAGYIEKSSAQTGIEPASNWVAVPMTVAGGDSRQVSALPAGLTPWFSTDHLVCPRRGTYTFALNLFVVPTMPAANYAAPSGTEAGATMYAGIGFGAGDPTGTSSLVVDLLMPGETLHSVQYSETVLWGQGSAATAYVRAISPLTSIDISYSAGTVVSRLSFTEIPTW